MKLLTNAISKKLPKLYATEGVTMDDKMVICKFFTPWSNWTWYAIEYDGKDNFFGYVCGFEDELGYFSLSELKSIRGALGLKIERDLHFKPCKLSEVMKKSDEYYR
jgi:hypothetical protein